MRERAHRLLRREDQHAADEAVPRARLRRGDVRARVPDRRARGEARHRPVRAAAEELRGLEQRHAVLVEEPRGRATSSHRSTGTAGTRCARAPARRGSTASGWRARSGTAAAGRRRTRGRGSAPTAASPSSRRCRTSAPARAPRWRRSPPRSSASRSTASRSSLGDTARGPYATLSAGSSTLPSVGPAVRAAAADAKRQILEIAAQRYGLEERVLDIRNGARRLRGRQPLRRRSRSCSACSATRRSSARARAARTRPA